MRYFLFVLFYLSVITAVAQSRQEWRDSLETLSASLKQDPDNIDLRLRKAEADIQLERWDYALAEYGRILRADEKNLAALYFRAYVHERQKHYDLARVDYESFLAIQPLHLEARLGLAHILHGTGPYPAEDGSAVRCDGCAEPNRPDVS